MELGSAALRLQRIVSCREGANRWILPGEYGESESNCKSEEHAFTKEARIAMKPLENTPVHDKREYTPLASS